jgi:rare lipoprotein A (peptidoglycan hydrolase)
VHADTFIPGRQDAPLLPAIYPEFTVAPGLPHLQPACETIPAQPSQRGAWFRGIASWYGPYFNGRLTANGEIYNMFAMTAATTEFHPKLPLGTRVRVVDSHNGRSVVVRITDRGPLPNGRIIDLSYAAARKLAMVKPGIARVELHVLRWGDDRYVASRD